MGVRVCINWGRHPDVKIGLVGPPCEGIKGDEAQMKAHVTVQIVKSQGLRPQELHAFHRF